MSSRWVLGELLRLVVLVVAGAIVAFLGLAYWLGRGPVPPLALMLIGAGATLVGVFWFRHVAADPDDGPTTWRYRR